MSPLTPTLAHMFTNTADSLLVLCRSRLRTLAVRKAILARAHDYQLAADAGARRLRSADTAKCIVSRTYNNFGDRCFAAAGPRLWNTLPLN